jgi:hypothetical protein
MAAPDSPAQKPAAPDDVGAFVDALALPLRDAVRDLRAIVLAADPSITEGIKWNAPSFRTSVWFATMHLRAKQGVGMILHFGAKPRASAAGDVAIADPDGLLEWLGKDRARASFADRADIAAKQAAFSSLIRAWIAHV